MEAKHDNTIPWGRYGVFLGVFGAIFAASAAGISPINGATWVPVTLFVLMLTSLLFLHHYNLEAALAGLAALAIYCVVTGQRFELEFEGVKTLVGLQEHLIHEVPDLLNLAFMIAGFSVLAKLFEESNAGLLMPHILPDDWRGGAMLLCMVAIGSAFLDNIAACLIGGVVAKEVFQGRLTVGFIAALVMAANLGGAPSPVGDTTTIMIVNAGVPLYQITAGIPGMIMGTMFLAFFAGRQQHRHQPIVKEVRNVDVDVSMLKAVAVTLVCVIVCTLTIHITSIGVWAGLYLARLTVCKKIPWGEGWSHSTIRSALFLSGLVACAALMPKVLPDPTWYATGGLGVVSAFFDNIPLTKLAIVAGGFVWSLLAYSVGSGGSMMWFGSSAGVTLTKEPEFAEGRNAWKWIKEGWFVPLSYVVGFATIMGWLELVEWIDLPHTIDLVIELAMFVGFAAFVWASRQKNSPKLEVQRH